MTTAQNIVDELTTYHEELKSYKRLLECEEQPLGKKPIMRINWDHPEAQKRDRDSLREKLVRKTGALKKIIVEATGKQYIKLPVSIPGSINDMWDEAFNPRSFSSDILAALDYCITTTNEAIGKLEDDINKGLRDEQGNLIGEPPKDIAELSLNLFDKMQFHPKVVEASKDCFIAGNYREAILNAFICLIDYVKERTGLDLDGDDLMNQVFSINYDKEQRRITKYPIIRINELKNKSDRDEQQGFMFLCKGAAGGIRNPKAHKLIPQSNPLHTLEYLSFASLLVRRVEEGKIEKPNNKEQI